MEKEKRKLTKEQREVLISGKNRLEQLVWSVLNDTRNTVDKEEKRLDIDAVLAEIERITVSVEQGISGDDSYTQGCIWGLTSAANILSKYAEEASKPTE